MTKKTLKQVYSSKMNRALKVIYILLYIFAAGIIISSISEGSVEWWGVLITFAIFEFTRRSFYYITAGDIVPDKGDDEDVETEVTFVPNTKKDIEQKDSN
ncbi:hypothetical protein IT400_01575 [Candidatus Nomurabacteria bacterium]|nr:hypothetical protein [Candidatus Nomurabacteria bacterium]